MTTGYSPRSDSLAARTINFLLDNPGEELTANDVAVKFNADYKNVHTLLRKALEGGLLSRARNDEGEYVYSRGLNSASPPADQNVLARSLAPPRPGQPIVIELRVAITVDVRAIPTPTAQEAS